jgi:hypothetical protein
MEITRSFQTTGGALLFIERLAILGFSLLGWLASPRERASERAV